MALVGTSKSQTLRMLDELEARGHISIERGHRRMNIYRLGAQVLGATNDTQGVAEMTPNRVAEMTPLTVVSPTDKYLPVKGEDNIRSLGTDGASRAGSAPPVTHAMVMDLMGRIRRAKEIPQFESADNMAVKLLRTFTAQTEALAKLRRGGEQTVRVEHVHVYSGGQAVVGTIARGNEGAKGNVGQPDAVDDPRALAFAPGSPVWSENAKEHAMPVTRSKRQAPVPHARRRRG